MMEQRPLYRKDVFGACFSDCSAANSLLERLAAGIRGVFGSDFISLVCYGSLVWGGFDEALSDVDLAAVLRREISESDLPALRDLHAALEEEFPDWKDRVEVQYVGRCSLSRFREGWGCMANISPGEPLHLVPCTVDWLTNWYFAGEYGKVLIGAPREDVFPEIAHTEFLEAVRRSALEWPERLDDIRNSCGYQGYAVLTLCRACYTLSTGRQISKQGAAAWMAEKRPETAPLVADALRWRKEQDTGTDVPAHTLKRVEEFIQMVVGWVRTGRYE